LAERLEMAGRENRNHNSFLKLLANVE
jgi:hypothetical protein